MERQHGWGPNVTIGDGGAFGRAGMASPDAYPGALRVGGMMVVLAMCSAAFGDLRGDPGLLRKLMEVREYASGKVVTWQGKAAVRRAGPGYVDEEEIQFWLDEPAQAYRWRNTGVAAKRTVSGVLKDAPEEIETKSGIRSREGFFELKPGLRKPNSDKWENTLVIFPPDVAASRQKETPYFFDPMNYVRTWQGQDIAYLLRCGLDSANGSDRSAYSVEQNGQEIVYRIMLGGGDWSYTFDLSKGGSLVAAEETDERGGSHYEYQYALVDGVWLPKSAKVTSDRIGATGEEWHSENDVEFVESRANEPVPESVFTLEALGVQPGCYVSDHRIGCIYYYSGEIPKDVAKSLAAIGQGEAIPAALGGADTHVTGGEGDPPRRDGGAADAEGASVALADRVSSMWWVCVLAGVLVAATGIAVVARRSAGRKERP